ncbi:hypothetical protein GIB67_021595 [Kingdonia uniflora]|uniref:Aminotransferase-like plant mobile domain-containing protein n=1 Tax=Kingdonia uniflora TaxID=39325 RepID=A0A7J7MDX2_9MAGN|nr:hypothetical protein GIB67_021595 [Kingdonia uniflora]
MNEKVPPTASNRRKRELAIEGDLVTYKKKRNTIDLSTVVHPNTVDSANEGVSEALPPIESAQGEGATKNDNVGPSDKSLLRSFRFHIEKLPLRVHHHQSTWDLTKELQVVQDFVKLKSLDRIGAISYNYYNYALIFAFAERWPPETNSFHFKWGEMTPTLDDVEQLVGLPADGDVTVIGGTWGFPVILEKLKEHYAYKLEKVSSDGSVVAAKKKKGLTVRFIARAYMLYVIGSFLFPTNKGTDASARYLYLFAKDKVAKKWSWGSIVLAYMYYNLGAASRDDGRKFACCTTLFESWIVTHFPKLVGIPKEIDSDVYEHCTCWKWDVSVMDRYGGTGLLKFMEAFDNYKLKDVVWDPYRDKRDSLHAFKEVTFFYGASKIYPINVDLATNDDVGIHQRKPVIVNEHDNTPVYQSEDIAEQYDASHHEYASLSPNINLNDQQITTLNDQLQKLKEDKEKKSEANINLREVLKEKCKEIESLRAINTILIEQIDMKLPPATPRYKLVNAKERMKSLEANNSKWKALVSEGMGDMGDPTFKELYGQNERFFTITQQGPKGDYQEDLVSMAVTLENVVIARREKMAKKKKMQ